jgi:hypothetical protein
MKMEALVRMGPEAVKIQPSFKRRLAAWVVIREATNPKEKIRGFMRREMRGE